MSDHEHELDIDDAIAQSLTSAIASRAAGDPGHALYIMANVVMYIGTIMGTDNDDFLKTLKKVEENTDFSAVCAASTGPLVEDNEDEELPKQNAPTSGKLN